MRHIGLYCAGDALSGNAVYALHMPAINRWDCYRTRRGSLERNSPSSPGLSCASATRITATVHGTTVCCHAADMWISLKQDDEYGAGCGW